VSGERPASLADPDGSVWLSPHGARLVHLALALLLRQAHRTGATPASDLAYLAMVVRLAVARADGADPGTAKATWMVTLPASDALVTAAEAAAILGVTSRAVRKAISQGRLPGARRLSSGWVIPEYEVRTCRHGSTSRRRTGRDPGSGTHRQANAS
jgi:hypothetical protein